MFASARHNLMCDFDFMMYSYQVSIMCHMYVPLARFVFFFFPGLAVRHVCNCQVKSCSTFTSKSLFCSSCFNILPSQCPTFKLKDSEFGQIQRMSVIFCHCLSSTHTCQHLTLWRMEIEMLFSRLMSTSAQGKPGFPGSMIYQDLEESDGKRVRV